MIILQCCGVPFQKIKILSALEEEKFREELDLHFKKIPLKLEFLELLRKMLKYSPELRINSFEIKIGVQNPENIDDTKDIEKSFKLAIFGQSVVGKTNLLLRYSRGIVDYFSSTTQGFCYTMKKIYVDQHLFKTTVCDTPGQEKFRTMCKYLRLPHISQGILLVFASDLDNSWVRDFSIAKEVPVLLVQNKVDLLDNEEKQKDYELYNEFAKEHGFIGFIQTSAQTGENVEEAFEKISREILRTERNNGDQSQTQTIQLSSKTKYSVLDRKNSAFCSDC